MLNVWKYDHLCEILTFNGYLCEICSVFENMTICVKMWFLLDICVRYAQCVKIWQFDVFVLFLKCVQFLKSCVQFLRDTILNLATIQFLRKIKGDSRYRGASPFYFTCTKKIFNNLFTTWASYPCKRVPCNGHKWGKHTAWGRRSTWSTSH
jgi:hypothetical protein